MIGSGRAGSAVRRLRRRFWPRAVVLMYHRVVRLPNDPQLLAVTPDHFEQHLEVIRKLARPLSLAALGQHIEGRTIPARSVVVTFDDGYADNLHHAMPALEAHNVPATVFVTAGNVGRATEFWWDELDRVVLQPGTLPPSLRLRIGPNFVHWDANGHATFSESDLRRTSGWHIESQTDPTARHRLYRMLYQSLHDVSGPERACAIDELRSWAGAGCEGRASHRVMNWSELRQLADTGLVEIGAHTLTHPPLGTLSPDEQRSEIVESKLALEGALGREVRGFAYPHGSMDQHTRHFVQSAGFSHACCSEPDAVFQDADRLQIPRLVVRDRDGPVFEKWLKGWIGG